MAIEVRSFFIGIGTVLAILAVGFGGGVMIGGMMSGTPHQPNKVERQAAKDAPAVRDVAAPALPASDAQPKDLNTLARNIDAIKPADPKPEPASQTQAVTQPQPVAPQATAPSQVIQPAPPVAKRNCRIASACRRAAAAFTYRGQRAGCADFRRRRPGLAAAGS